MRLASSLRQGLYAAMVLLALSGAVWLWAHYLVTAGGVPDGFAANAMAVHGMTATAILILGGSAIALHAPAAWRERTNRLSGFVLSATLLILAATGCLLYYIGDEAARAAMSLIHSGLGLAAPLVLAWHAWRGQKARWRKAQ